MEGRHLPAQFEDLDRFVARWALPNEFERHKALISSSIDDVRELYDALMPRFDSIVAHLDQYKLAELPADAQCLLDLAMTFVETSHTIELKWQQTDIRDTFPIERVRYLGPSSSF